MAKYSKDFKIIGKSVANVDIEKLVTGKPLFGLDYKEDGMVYSCVLRPPAFGQTLISFDSSESIKINGVIDVVKLENKVAVIAKNTFAAIQGKKALRAEWKNPKILEDSIFHKNKLNELLDKGEFKTMRKDGDVAKAFSEADKIIEKTYESPFLPHSCMEPMNFFANVTDKKIDLVGPIQTPDNTSKQVAEMLKRDISEIDLKMTRMGGGFGRRLRGDFVIEAQLTTEIFGFFSPARPDFAVEMAELPIQTTARFNAEWISKFYVSMYSMAANADPNLSVKDNLISFAEKSRKELPDDSYASKMYDFVKKQYYDGIPWETIRDNVYQRYQVEQKDGYDLTSRNMRCNACAAAGINFAASIVSLFAGEGDLKETIKIGSLAGWDSDNPTATWGGLIGFMIGADGVEKAFDRTFSEEYNIHRTRQNFPNGIDNFTNMANIGVFITDRVIQNELGGGVDLVKNLWYIPKSN